MYLYLLRHGIAYDHGDPAYPIDDDRPLTPEGRKKFRRAAAGLLELIDPPAIILTSPLPRAAQTAEILQQACGSATRTIVAQSLRPGGSRDDVLQECRSQIAAATGEGAQNPVLRRGIALVGHEPSLGLLAAWLLNGDEAGSSLPLRKGGGACFLFEDELQAGHGQLEWLLTPRIMRSLVR